jgi:outer membrane lipoprotein-sorting protein
MGVMRGFLATAMALACVMAAGAQSNDPVALAAKVQQRYNAIKDIQADFVQTY